MSVPLLGIIASSLCIFLLSLLFRIETKQGRFFERPRRHFDFLILKIENAFGRVSRLLGSDFFRQTIHYFFHAMLLTLSRMLATSEKKVERMLRSNRLLARKARRERTTRNKLDEIAEHRAKIAFSKEERQRHKERALDGR